jgi:acetyltransferase-like isoleucine patch superfamily enzyme
MGMPFPVTLLADRPGANIIIGDESRLHGCCIHAWREVRVGRKCLVAAGVNVIDSNGHSTELRLARIRDRTPDTPNPVVIGDHCWLGYGALVLKGVTLGEGCIVAAYSVVRTGSYPPFSLVAGNPARVVASLDAGEVLPESLTDEELHSLGVKPRRFRAGAP